MKRPANLLYVLLFVLLHWSIVNSSIAQQENRQPKRVALVVGNSAYANAPLANPVNDAQALFKPLESLGFSVTLQMNRSKQELEADIDEITKELGRGDICLVFFAGHGLQVDNNNYLIPIDAEVSRKHHVAERCVNANFLLGALEDSGASLKIIVLDCCRNNPFRSFDRGGTVGLAKLTAPEGTVIVYSTAPGTEAADGDGENSPFAHFLVETILANHADGLEIIELFKETARAVKKAIGQLGYLEQDISMDQFWIKPPKPTGVELIDDDHVGAELQLSLRTENGKREFQEGETLKCEIKANSNCFVSLFSHDPDGELTMLVPNKWHPQGLEIKADETTVFPTKQMGFEFFVKPPHGRTTLKAIATKQPLQISGVDVQRLLKEEIVELGNTQDLQTAKSDPADSQTTGSGFNLATDSPDKKFQPDEWATSRWVITTSEK